MALRGWGQLLGWKEGALRRDQGPAFLLTSGLYLAPAIIKPQVTITQQVHTAAQICTDLLPLGARRYMLKQRA